MSESPASVAICNDIKREIENFFGGVDFSKIAVLVDENTMKHCLPVVEFSLPKGFSIIEIKSGEEQKNLDTCARIWKSLTDEAFDRKSLLINLGGGVIGDMGGFCAATFKRGISFINIPTTLLSQVDASVGGKLGIDFFGFKNHIGVFKDPLKVFISSEFLNTLDERELRSGYAEVIKHCLIADRGKFFELASKGIVDQDWDDVIAHSVQVKSNVVKADPKENGLRKVLNFGHTLGHAVETFYLNKGKRILHGEAIAVGMVCESWLSEIKAGLRPEDTDFIFSYISNIYDLEPIDEKDFDEIVELTLQDKKNESNRINASLLEDIGKCLFNIPLTKDEMTNSLKNYNERLKA